MRKRDRVWVDGEHQRRRAFIMIAERGDASDALDALTPGAGRSAHRILSFRGAQPNLSYALSLAIGVPGMSPSNADLLSFLPFHPLQTSRLPIQLPSQCFAERLKMAPSVEVVHFPA